MKLQLPRVLACRLAACCVLSISMLGHVQGQPESKSDSEPTPTTTADPGIPVEHLDLLLKPLTQEELDVEADGWRDLVKSKLQEISELKIAMLGGPKQAPDPTEVEAPAEGRQSDAERLGVLEEERTERTERLSRVLDALEEKGGEVEGYRQYVRAVSGISLDVADKTALWTLLKGWLTSEKGGLRWLWNIAKFLVLLAAFYFAARFVSNVVRHAVSRVKGVSQLLVGFLATFVKQIFLVIGLIVALSALEVNIAPLLAAIGAAGFVIALALQNTLSNFASGLLILFYRPFDVGDVIEAAGISGIVNSVKLFSTHIRTFDNKLMIVPNNDIWGGTITNATASDTRRIDMEFGIGYDDDIDKAKEILERLVKEHPLVLEDPEPVIELHQLADSSMNFICRPWSKTSDYWNIYWDLTRSVKQEFDRNGISIPFPQRDIHVYHESAPEG